MSTQRLEAFQKRTVGYTTLPQPVTTDVRLSFKALGILAYLLSRPDDWRPNYRQLAKSHADGAHAVMAGLRELEAAGYYSRTKVRHRDGSFGWVTTVSETPNLLEPCSDQPCSGFPGTENRGSTKDSGGTTEEEGEVEASASPSPRMDTSFDAFWEGYPKKVGKGAARAAYVKALRKVEENVLLSACCDYAASRRGKDKQYTLNPATWLNQERWDDEQAPSRVGVLPDAPMPDWMKALAQKEEQ